jgi:biopolymer transport protein ExbB/TolQ
MKAYLATTGTIFGLIALMHFLKSFQDRAMLTTHPTEYLVMSALGLVAAALSVWAWWLFGRQIRRSKGSGNDGDAGHA